MNSLSFTEGGNLDFTASLFKARNQIGPSGGVLRWIGEEIGSPLYEQESHTFADLPNGMTGTHYHRALASQLWLGLLGYRPVSATVPLPAPGYQQFHGNGRFRAYFWIRGVMPLSWWGSQIIQYYDGTAWRRIANGDANTGAGAFGLQYDFSQMPLVTPFETGYPDFNAGLPVQPPPYQIDNPRQRFIPMNATQDESDPGDSDGAFYLDRICEYSTTLSGPAGLSAQYSLSFSNPAGGSFFKLGGVGAGEISADTSPDLGAPILGGFGARYAAVMWANDAQINPPRIFDPGNMISATDISEAHSLRFVNCLEIVFLGALPELAGSPPKFSDLAPPRLSTTL